MTHSFLLYYLGLFFWQGDEHVIGVDQRDDHVMGLEDLQQNEIEHLKHGSASVQESLTLEEVSMNMTNSSEMQRSVEVMLNMAGSNQLTTACVWCGVEFKHEAVDYEVQHGSVGFMCPVCKANISEREWVRKERGPCKDQDISLTTVIPVYVALIVYVFFPFILCVRLMTL